jgi:peptide methionine sulfoxide reductase MsrB
MSNDAHLTATQKAIAFRGLRYCIKAAVLDFQPETKA